MGSRKAVHAQDDSEGLRMTPVKRFSAACKAAPHSQIFSEPITMPGSVGNMPVPAGPRAQMFGDTDNSLAPLLEL